MSKGQKQGKVFRLNNTVVGGRGRRHSLPAEPDPAFRLFCHRRDRLCRSDCLRDSGDQDDLTSALRLGDRLEESGGRCAAALRIVRDDVPVPADAAWGWQTTETLFREEKPPGFPRGFSLCALLCFVSHPTQPSTFEGEGSDRVRLSQHRSLLS